MFRFRRRVSTVLLMLVAMLHLVACEAGLVDPAERDPAAVVAQMASIDGATVAPIDPVHLEDFATIQEKVFETLFTQQYDPAHFAYEMRAPVTGEGVWSGANQFGDAFDLDVRFLGEIALEDLGLDPQAEQEARDAGFVYASVLAWISANGQRLAVSGATFHANLPGQGRQSRFMVTGIEDPTSPAFAGDAALGTDGLATLGATAIAVDPTVEPSDDACRQRCLDEFDDAVDQAQQDYADAVNAAEDAHDAAIDAATTARDTAINGANSTYQSAVDGAKITLAAALTACHVGLIGAVAGCSVIGGILSLFTAGVALALCIAGAHAAYAYCTYASIDSYNGALATAAAVRNAAITAANAAFQAAKNAADIALQQALDTAQDVLENAIESARLALEECLRQCRRAKLQVGDATEAPSRPR